MVGPRYDCVTNPIGAVRSTFKEAIAGGTDPTDFEGEDWGAVGVFRDFLAHQNGLSQVPILDHKTAKWIRRNTLVRFRGMIQDMIRDETYVGAYKDGSTWRTTKFMGYPEVPIEPSMETRKWERNSLKCVPVPGQSSWVKSCSDEILKSIIERFSDQREKRLLSDDETVDHMGLGQESSSELEGSHIAKKRREDGYPYESSQTQSSISEDAAGSSAISQADIFKSSLSFVVKIYDTPVSEFKVNGVFEFIGIFTLESENQHGFNVPHLHCFIHKKLALHDFLQKPHMFDPNPCVAKVIRESLIRHLTNLLGQDSLAAHFIMLHLLSNVQNRDNDHPVGKLSVNLTGFNLKDMHLFSTQLQNAIKSLLPFAEYLPITTVSLNSALFTPKNDDQLNKIITGPLQLADGTHLILEESRVETGSLNSVGVANARSLKTLIEYQTVYYHHQFFEAEEFADIQLLVLSDRKSSLCPADLVLPYRPSSSEVLTEPSTEALDSWRWYLATLRSLPHTIEPELKNVIKNDFVQAKNIDQNLDDQDFDRLLTMARLMSTSYGETSLSMERWEMVKKLERQRRERLV